jgi:mycofactocin precursor
MRVDQTDLSDAAAEPEGTVSGAPVPEPVPSPLVEEELLVEDVSIDGMCGVY